LLECAGLSFEEIRPIADAMEQGGRKAAARAGLQALSLEYLFVRRVEIALLCSPAECLLYAANRQPILLGKSNCS